MLISASLVVVGWGGEERRKKINVALCGKTTAQGGRGAPIEKEEPGQG